MHKLLCAITIGLVLLKAHAVDLVKLQFTRSDGTIWLIKAYAPYPENPWFVGQSDNYRGVQGIGSHTNFFAGSSYTINPSTDVLLKNGAPVGQIHWRVIGTNYVRVDVITHYGFAIDDRGRGWLATAQNDGDPEYYLFRLDLNTAEAFYVDRISLDNDPEILFPVNGMVVLPPPVFPVKAMRTDYE